MLSQYLLVAVDVRRALQPGSTRGGLVTKCAVPGIKFVNSEHNPGGGVMAVNFVQPRIEAPEPKFEIKGIDTDIFGGLGQVDRWVFAGAYREKKPGGGGVVPGRCIIEGAISAWEPDESDPTEFQGCNHTFTEVTHCEFHLGDEELFYVDHYERVLRVKGVDIFDPVRRALGA
ncbi:phage major tail tube protein [Paradevosia shaoguanensis]|uniref:phage major tail tube protein n=1 Tax=Paradevosia shaoguanensis TaxID=1335043 RepID=UPI003C74D9B4